MMIEACGFGDAPLMESCLNTQAAQRFTEVANQPLGTTDLSASSGSVLPLKSSPKILPLNPRLVAWFDPQIHETLPYRLVH